MVLLIFWGVKSHGNSGPTTRDASKSRILIVSDPKASEAFRTDPQRILTMVKRGITGLTGKATSAEAWRTLISAGDVVGLKVYSLPGPNSGTRLAVAGAVVEDLVAAGVSPANVIVWDKNAVDLRLSGFYDLVERYGVKVAGAREAGYDPEAFYDSPVIGNLVWGDSEFGKQGDSVGRKSFVSRLVSQKITKIINIPPMLNHNLVGVSGNLFTLAVGSVDNTLRFEVNAERLAFALPEVYALPQLSDKVVLNIVDALVCQYEGGERGLLHYSASLNELRFSTDPVALDVLSVLELDRLRRQGGAKARESRMELYNNAAVLELGHDALKDIQVDRLE